MKEAYCLVCARCGMLWRRRKAEGVYESGLILQGFYRLKSIKTAQPIHGEVCLACAIDLDAP